jgi:DNA-binding CsgD family transcriptional regulator
VTEAAASSGAASSPVGRGIRGRPLSRREQEVVRLLLRGDRVPSIAQQLWLTQSTIRNHLYSVFGKLGVKSQQELIMSLRDIPHPRQRGPDASSAAHACEPAKRALRSAASWRRVPARRFGRRADTVTGAFGNNTKVAM